MGRISGLVFVVGLAVAGCGSDEKSPGAATETRADELISEEDALRVAQTDALAAYKELDHYEVRSELKGAEWHIRYLLPKEFDGGGPSYVIDAKSGAILSKRYEQ